MWEIIAPQHNAHWEDILKIKQRNVTFIDHKIQIWSRLYIVDNVFTQPSITY